MTTATVFNLVATLRVTEETRWMSLWVNETTLSNVVASIIGATAFTGLLVLFRNMIAKLVRRWIPAFESRTPHINFQTDASLVDGEWRTTVIISNAANEPAYNVYVFMAERFPSDGSFTIRSLGASGVRRPVLGIRDSLTFDGVEMVFDGCNAMTDQQLWIEFENSAGIQFRTVAYPMTARGDEERATAPRIIKHRLEQLPDLVFEGDYKDWIKFRKGVKSVMGR